MGNSVYTIDILKTDGTTHYTRNVVITDEQIAAVTIFINHINQFAVGCNSATITKLTPGTSSVPVSWDAYKTSLEGQLPLGSKRTLVPQLP